jgi:hypothetical protein
MSSFLAPSTSWHSFLPAAAHVILHHVRSIKKTASTAVHATFSFPSLFSFCLLPNPPSLARCLALVCVHRSIHHQRRRPAPFRAAGPLLPFIFPSLPSFLPFPSFLGLVCVVPRSRDRTRAGFSFHLLIFSFSVQSFSVCKLV